MKCRQRHISLVTNEGHVVTSRSRSTKWERNTNKGRNKGRKKIPVVLFVFTWTRHNEGNIIDLIKIKIIIQRIWAVKFLARTPFYIIAACCPCSFSAAMKMKNVLKIHLKPRKTREVKTAGGWSLYNQCTELCSIHHYCGGITINRFMPV